MKKNLKFLIITTLLLLILFLLFLILVLNKDKPLNDYRKFYDRTIDDNENTISLSRNIFETQKEIDLTTYYIGELELEIKDLEYFKNVYDEYGPGKAKLSPATRVGIENISVYDKRIIIELSDSAYVGSVLDTGSMDPVLDVGSNTIKIKPKDISDIELGDIITYKPSFSERNIIHRVIKIDEDENGWYVIAKGDNNPVSDPERIRFEQITGVLIAILY